MKTLRLLNIFLVLFIPNTSWTQGNYYFVLPKTTSVESAKNTILEMAEDAAKNYYELAKEIVDTFIVTEIIQENGVNIFSVFRFNEPIECHMVTDTIRTHMIKRFDTISRQYQVVSQVMECSTSQITEGDSLVLRLIPIIPYDQSPGDGFFPIIIDSDTPVVSFVRIAFGYNIYISPNVNGRCYVKADN